MKIGHPKSPPTFCSRPPVFWLLSRQGALQSMEGLSRIRSFTQDTAMLFVFILWLMRKPHVLLISSQTTPRTGHGPSLSRLPQPQNWPGMNCKCLHFLSWLVKALFGKMHDFTAGTWDGKGRIQSDPGNRVTADHTLCDPGSLTTAGWRVEV